MKKNVLICGQAGQGVNFTSLLLGRALKEAGFYVFIYRDYGSLIKGGHNFNVITFSDRPVNSHQNKFSAVVDLDSRSSQGHRFIEKGSLVLNQKSLDLCCLKRQGQGFNEVNNILLGMLFKGWGLPFDFLKRATEKTIKKYRPVVKAMHRGYQCFSLKQKLKAGSKDDRFMLTGTEAVAIGAISSGLDVYLSYPMTPATGLLIELSNRAKKRKLLVAQLEDEVGLINTALGASYAGAMAMIGSSGGGFALMTEGLSLSGMAEIPLLIYFSQRTGPSTGVPTYTGQSDLAFARFAGHGEFPRVLVAPGSPPEALTRTIEAFYLAYKYRLPAILLSDKHLSQSYYTFDRISYPRIKPDRFVINNPKKDHPSYGHLGRSIPGQKAWARASSYEHDQFGFTVEDAESIKKMNEKRIKKMNQVEREVARWQPARVWGRGANLIIGSGSTQGAILDSLPALKNYRFLEISYLNPFPREMVKKEISRSKKVVLVENNLTGLLGSLLAMETGCLIKDKVRKYDGRPFTADEIVDEVKKL